MPTTINTELMRVMMSRKLRISFVDMGTLMPRGLKIPNLEKPLFIQAPGVVQYARSSVPFRYQDLLYFFLVDSNISSSRSRAALKRLEMTWATRDIISNPIS